jgi:hypothetical protein
LGTESKVVCEGTFGICMYLEVQKGKVKLQWQEKKKRCVFADSWFASVETALALKEELGIHFTGPIKTAHKYFLLEPIRWVLNELSRGEHVVLKNENADLWLLVGKTMFTSHT